MSLKRQPIYHGTSNHIVTKYFIPTIKGEIGRDDGSTLTITAR